MGCVLGTGMLGPKRGEMVLKRKGRFFVKERPFLGILVCFSALLKKGKPNLMHSLEERKILVSRQVK